MNHIILTTLKELVDDAKLGCTDMVFKDLCIELLAKGKLLLTERQFAEFSDYVVEKLKEEAVLSARAY